MEKNKQNKKKDLFDYTHSIFYLMIVTYIKKLKYLLNEQYLCCSLLSIISYQHFTKISENLSELKNAKMNFNHLQLSSRRERSKVTKVRFAAWNLHSRRVRHLPIGSHTRGATYGRKGKRKRGGREKEERRERREKKSEREREPMEGRTSWSGRNREHGESHGGHCRGLSRGLRQPAGLN